MAAWHPLNLDMILLVGIFFPDHAIGINFDHQHGIVKMIWQANKYKHCTLPHSPSSLHLSWYLTPD
jgi:hypothetical protein